MRKIGVAVSIPEPYAAELQAARARFGDPLADSIPAHVTLLPPTMHAIRAEAQLDAHLEMVATEHAPFRMLLRGTGTFRPVSPVVFVQVAAGIAECERLAADVRTGPLAARDLEFPFHPHVTIAHDIDEDAMERAFDELASYAADFEVDAFSLFHHGADGVWRPVRAYRLAGRAPRPSIDGAVSVARD